MTQVVQDFLWAQKVQEPIALYSDWLVVGHVDEFMTFVPAPDRKVKRYVQNTTIHHQSKAVTFCFWKKSHAHQGCIYLIKNTIKQYIFKWQYFILNIASVF